MPIFGVEGAEVFPSDHLIEFERNILIVEDDPVSALLLRKVLESRGYLVEAAADGREALQKFDASKHRIVITDWMMPELDGVALTTELRSRSSTYVYVLLLTAKAQREDRLTAFAAGVDDILVKPLDREDLFARLKVAERIISAEERLVGQTEELHRAGERLKLANVNLATASRRFEDLFDFLPVACFTFDTSGVIHEWNKEAASLFEIAPHEAFQKSVSQVFSAFSDFWTPELIQEFFAGKKLEQQEWTFTRPSTPQKHLVCEVFPLLGSQGEFIGAISANLDLTEQTLAKLQIEENMREIESQKSKLEGANQRLERLAITDGLTDLINHRRFQEELEQCFSVHHRSSRPLSVVFLDVDNFKSYNDAFGHPAGDVVLKLVAEKLRAVSRKHELPARYGGEEFAIILPDTDMQAAKHAAERFRQAIEGISGTERAVTASFGVASTCEGTESAKDLIQRADVALYEAKSSGRNCVRHHADLGKKNSRSKSDKTAA